MESVFNFYSKCIHMWHIPLKFCSKNVIFPISMSSSKNLSIIVFFFGTAKYDEVSCENSIVRMCEIGMDPGLCIKPIVLYF